MIKEASTHKNILRIKTEAGLLDYAFDYDILEFKIIDDKVIVRLDALRARNEIRNRNIFCVDQNAKILWQIQEHHAKRPFTGFRVMEDSLIRIYNWTSDYWDIQLDTGEWVRSLWGIHPIPEDAEWTNVVGGIKLCVPRKVLAKRF